MALPRAILGVPAAIALIKDVLGAPKMSAVTGKSERRMYWWSQQDSDYSPNVHDAILLDAAYIQAGGDEPPILKAYQRQLTLLADISPRRPDDLPTSLAKAAKECGEAISAACETLTPNAPLSARRRAIAEVNQGITALIDLCKVVTATIEKAADA